MKRLAAFGLAVGVLALGVLAGAAGRARAAEIDLADEIKATFLYKFAPFVDWPNGTFPAPATPLVLCVVGDDPFGSLLDAAIRSRPPGDRPIMVRRFSAISGGEGCHIVFASGSAAQSRAQVLAAVRDRAVLTITDGSVEPLATGIINFVLSGNRVRFQINDVAAARRGLSISSKLLSLATFVRQ